MMSMRVRCSCAIYTRAQQESVVSNSATLEIVINHISCPNKKPPISRRLSMNYLFNDLSCTDQVLIALQILHRIPISPQNFFDLEKIVFMN